MPLSELFAHHGAAAPRPASIEVNQPAGVLSAPVSGSIVGLERVSDPVFSSGMMGPGIAITPTSGILFAPAAGKVMATVSSCHAVALLTAEGAEVLVHVGIDTVGLHGEGFVGFVEKGREVVAGEPLVSFDRSLIASRGLDPTVIVCVTNADAFASVDLLAEGAVAAGDALLKTVR